MTKQGFIASNFKSKKSQPSLKEVVSRSAKTKETSSALVQIWNIISMVPKMGTEISLRYEVLAL